MRWKEKRLLVFFHSFWGEGGLLLIWYWLPDIGQISYSALWSRHGRPGVLVVWGDTWGRLIRTAAHQGCMIDLNGFFCNCDKMDALILLTGLQTTHCGCTAHVTNDVFVHRRQSLLIDLLMQCHNQGLERIPPGFGQEGTVTKYHWVFHDDRRNKCEKSVDLILHFGCTFIERKYRGTISTY